MINLSKYTKATEKSYYKRLGKVVNVIGLTIESNGPDAKLDDLCKIVIDEESNRSVLAEVVGFKEGKTLLMPYERDRKSVV